MLQIIARGGRPPLAPLPLFTTPWYDYFFSHLRTEKEAISIANNTMYGLGASVHSEKLPLALETAKHIKAGTVWINCHNMFDAAAGFGGYKQSGFGRYTHLFSEPGVRIRNRKSGL